MIVARYHKLSLLLKGSMIAVSAALVLLFHGTVCSAQSPAAKAANEPLIIVVPTIPNKPGDTDEDPFELVYHWQNAFFYQDQERQIAYLIVFLISVGAVSFWKGRQRLCPPQA